MVDVYTSTCFDPLIGNTASTDRQLIECIATTFNRHSYDRLRSMTLVFAGFLIFVMQVCCFRGMKSMYFSLNYSGG